MQPVDIYQQAERAVKYAVLFIVLTFLVFFLWEVFSATLLHPMQYAFVGSRCASSTCCWSRSPNTPGFDRPTPSSLSRRCSSRATPARCSAGSPGLSVCAALVALYGFLYLLLRLEDYALLAGSVGLFLVLALVMFITRRMDWYELKLGEG